MRTLAIAALVVLAICTTSARASFQTVAYQTELRTSSLSFDQLSGIIPLFDPARFVDNPLVQVDIVFTLRATAPLFEAKNLTGSFQNLHVELSDSVSLQTFGLPGGNVSLFVGEAAVPPVDILMPPFASFTRSPASEVSAGYSTQDVERFVGAGNFQFITFHAFVIESSNLPPSVAQLRLAPDYLGRGSVTVTYTFVTPAPPSAVLAAVGAAGLAGYGWRRRKIGAAGG